MDWQTLVNIGGTAGLSIVGWFIRSALAEAKEQRLSLVAFRIEVAKEYVTHTDLRRIEDALVRIEAKLDAKADK